MTVTNNQVKVFRHLDLDGYGVGIVAKAIFGVDMVDETPCENHEVDAKVKEFLDSGEYIFYDMIIVGDLSFGKEVADIIESHENLRKKFLLVDHHKTALWLNNYSFAKVEVERNGLKASGTSSLLEILLEQGYDVEDEYSLSALQSFAEKVRRYDTWDWKNIYSDEKANMLNQLYYMVGHELFGESMLEKLSSKNTHYFVDGEWDGLFTSSEIRLLKVENTRMEKYIDKRCDRARFCEQKGYSFAYVYADQYHSQLGNKMCELFNVDFAMIIDIDKGKVSLRSIGDRFDVSVIAEEHGGGGHKNASGFMFDVDHNLIMDSVLNERNETKKESFISKIVKFIDNLL